MQLYEQKDADEQNLSAEEKHRRRIEELNAQATLEAQRNWGTVNQQASDAKREAERQQKLAVIAQSDDKAAGETAAKVGNGLLVGGCALVAGAAFESLFGGE